MWCEHIHHAGKISFCLGPQQGHVPGIETDSGAVQQNELMDALRPIGGKLQSDPAAHGPAGHIRLLEILAVKKQPDDVFFERDGIINIRTCGLTIAEQVRCVNLIAMIHELRDQRDPVFTAASQSMHQNQRLAGSADQVMDFLAVQNYILLLQPHSPNPELLQLVDEELRMKIKTEQPDCSKQYQKQENQAQSPGSRSNFYNRSSSGQ